MGCSRLLVSKIYGSVFSKETLSKLRWEAIFGQQPPLTMGNSGEEGLSR